MTHLFNNNANNTRCALTKHLGAHLIYDESDMVRPILSVFFFYHVRFFQEGEFILRFIYYMKVYFLFQVYYIFSYFIFFGERRVLNVIE